MKSILLGTALAAASLSGEAGAVTSHPVTFLSVDQTVTGDLYLPDTYKSGQRIPALVITGAWMTVRQQMPALYAREMANRGFAVLIFDFRGWGESGGLRRQFEDPHAKILDIEAAVKFLATRPEVDAKRIGGFGICASSGYMVTAATETPAIKSVALVAPWLQDADVVSQTYGGKPGVDKLIEKGSAAEADYRRSGRQDFVLAASTTDETAVMYKALYYTEPNRGMIPAWRNEADLAFWPGWLSFDSIQVAPRLHQPFIMVHSEAAAIPQGAHKFYGQLTGTRQELWLPNVTQFDFYDQPGPVKAASDAVASHFRATLK